MLLQQPLLGVLGLMVLLGIIGKQISEQRKQRNLQKFGISPTMPKN